MPISASIMTDGYLKIIHKMDVVTVLKFTNVILYPLFDLPQIGAMLGKVRTGADGWKPNLPRLGKVLPNLFILNKV